MVPVPDSFDKILIEQKALLPTEEEIPSARVVVMGIVIHFLASGERLFPKCCLRCAELTSNDSRVNVGRFDSDGFYVSHYWDDLRGDFLGLASSRKF
jgi:hypothetical protein